MDPARLAKSEALHVRARAFVAAFEASTAMPEPFDAVACDLARFQADSNAGYARLCAARHVDHAALASANAIPAVPTDAFKVTRVSTLDDEDVEHARSFRTSGTTVGSRGTHLVRDLSSYELGASAFGRHWLARDIDVRPLPILALMPEVPDSSLAFMCGLFTRSGWGDGAGGGTVFVVSEDGVIDLDMLDQRVVRAEAEGVPVLVCGASFAFVHFLEALGDATFALPPKSRVMQTGGFKGKRREVPKDELRAEIARIFEIDPRAVVAEYGMTELSSQFYEKTLFEPGVPHDVFAEPPWARVIPVDPETLAPVPDGEVGIAKIIDLLNVDSAVAVLTQDRVRRVEDGFELLGRAPGAPPRGCSIAIDEILGRDRT